MGAQREPLRIFAGWDSRETIGYHVFCHSVISRASGPVSITPLVQSQLRASGLYTRERKSNESTEFSMTRFLIPALCGYKGYAVFMDGSDMLALGDVCELWDIIEHDTWNRPRDENGRAGPRPSVWVCKHEYTTTQTVKFLNQVNVHYPRKNWSSFIIFDCSRCTQLTPERVNILSGLELHRFSWMKDEELASLPVAWNWLVGEYQGPQVWHSVDEPNVLHYTLGSPVFSEYANCDYANLWFQERDAMLSQVAAA